MTEEDNSLNPLHPIISVNILYTILCTLCYVLTRRICLTIKSSFFNGCSFPFCFVFFNWFQHIFGWFMSLFSFSYLRWAIWAAINVWLHSESTKLGLYVCFGLTKKIVGKEKNYYKLLVPYRLSLRKVQLPLFPNYPQCFTWYVVWLLIKIMQWQVPFI